MKEHDIPLHDLNFVPFYEEIQIDMAEGEVRDVEMHDGSHLRLRKIGNDYDPTNKDSALNLLRADEKSGEVSTGIIYVDPKADTFMELLNLSDEPLATLPQSVTRPSREALEMVMEELR
jgi:2-oxoglutarate ferredoxin oxidoreductase subunit beta